MKEVILPLIPEGATTINGLVTVCRDDEYWTYFHGAFPIYKHSGDDLQSFRLTIARMVDSGVCRQCHIIKAFKISKNCAIRAVRQLRERGPESFYQARKTRRGGTILTKERLSEAQQLFDAGASRSQVAAELGVKSDTLRKAISDGRLIEREKVGGATKSQRSVEDAEAASRVGTACTREDERLMAAVGLLAGGATVAFEKALDVPHGGVLCALPALIANGLLNGVEKCLGELKGYYTQFNILLLLAFMALCRIKTVEKLGAKPSGEMGLLLGLDRSPGVRCLREKIGELAGEANADDWAGRLSRQWMDANPDACGYLYVDGHVGVYHGEKTKLPRRYVSRERLCLRGVSNYWVNDVLGQPFFVVERQLDHGLTEALRSDILPRLLKDVPDQPTERDLEKSPFACRFAIVFDREAYSPKLFKHLWEERRVGCVTYHKYPKANWPEEEFFEHVVKLANGETVKMKLAERGSLVGTGRDALWMREIRKLSESGHQTSIISTVFEPETSFLAPRMFARWCQENFLRYMMQHFAIDQIPAHGVEAFHGAERVVNPTWRRLQSECNSLANKLRYRKAAFLDLELKPTSASDSKKYDRWEKKKAELLEEIEQLEERLKAVKAKRKETPKHITLEELPEDQKFHRLATAKKRLTDTIKMIAYRAETAMAVAMGGDTKSIAEARAILEALFQNEADLIPNYKEKTLTVRVHGASTPATNRKILKLLEHLNQTEREYPGSDLIMIYECAIPPSGTVSESKEGDTAISGG